MSQIKRALVLFFLTILPIHVFGQHLKVGVILQDKPFSWQESNKMYTGIAVDIFSHIAEELKWKYTFIPINPPLENVFDRVQKGEFDIIVGPISITHERYQKVDFSLPFFLNSLGIIVKRDDSKNIFFIMMNDIGEKIGYIMPFLLTYFFIIMICFYLIDNIKNFSWKPRNILSKLGNAFWQTLVILIHPEFKESKRIIKRIILLAWVLPSTIFFSMIVGSIVSTISVLESKKSYIYSLKKEDLVGKKLVTLKGNVTIAEGEKIGAMMIAVSSKEEGLKMVADGTVFGMTGDHIILENAVQTHPDLNITMSNINLRNDQLAFVFKKGFHGLDDFNEQLLFLQDEDFAIDICSRYIGNRGNLCIL